MHESFLARPSACSTDSRVAESPGVFHICAVDAIPHVNRIWLFVCSDRPTVIKSNARLHLLFWRFPVSYCHEMDCLSAGFTCTNAPPDSMPESKSPRSLSFDNKVGSRHKDRLLLA